MLLLLFSAAFLSAGSLFLGIEGGYTLNGVTAAAPDYRANTDYTPWSGYNVSLPLLFQFSDNFAFETGVMINRKSWRYFHEYGNNIILDARMHNLYLEIPLIALYVYHNGFISVNAGCGLFLGFNLMKTESGIFLSPSLGENLENEYVHYNEKAEWSEYDNIFQLGLIGKLRLSFEISDDFFLFISTSGEISFIPLQRAYQRNQMMLYNISMMISAGCMFSFGDM